MIFSLNLNLSWLSQSWYLVCYWRIFQDDNDEINQHPFTFQCCCSATQQMQGQQSFVIWEKYLKQSRSIGTSAPFSLAAFSQTGSALLISSMHLTSRSWGHSWSPMLKVMVRVVMARRRRMYFMICCCDRYIINLIKMTISYKPSEMYKNQI